MSKKYQGFKFTYNSTTTEFSTFTDKVDESQEEATSIVTTPNNSRYKQIFGLSKRWAFSYEYINDTGFDFFNDAYNATVDGANLTFSVEQDDGSYTDYTVIINRPQGTPHTIGTTKFYRNFSAEIFEA